MSKIPTGGSRKPTTKKSFSMDDFRKKVGGEVIEPKPLEWYNCSKALQKETGLPGYPKGYVSLSRGFSNTGKSTSVFEAAIDAQKQGDFPILIDTENNIGRDRLKLMGFDWEKPHLYIDNEYILENFSKKRDKTTNEPTIEDMADMIHYFLNMQDMGDLPFNICFIIDSIGTLNCIKSVNASEKGTSDNNMWNAGAYEHAFKSLLNSRIPSSRKSNKQYINTLIAVQKIWIDSMGAGVVKHKGGEAFFFAARLIYHQGGIAAHGTRAVAATSKTKSVTYGIETKISVAKNHIDGPLGGISMEGKIISTPHGFISPDDIEEYKKQNILYFRKVLGEELTPDEIKTKYHQITDVGDEEQSIDDFNESMKTNFGELEVDTETGEVI